MTTRRKKKIERRSLLAEYWSRPVANELDIVDKGDALEVQSCSSEVAGWWLGTLRALYPQDQYSGDGDHLKMHPAMGVTLKVDKNDGTLTIKGKRHLQWFKDNFDNVLSASTKEYTGSIEFSKLIDRYLKLNDGYTVAELLEHLPPSGAIRHSPSYIYRLWRGLLDQWMAGDGRIYIVSPLLDAKRLADILLLLCKHKLSQSRVQIFTNRSCDGETKYVKTYKAAREMVQNLKTPTTKKQFIVDDRLHSALERLDAKFGVFHVKLIACVMEQYTELVLTSASFHAMHFQYDHADMALFMRIHNEDFEKDYLQPLGMAPSSFQRGSAPILSFNDSADDSTL